MANPWLTRWSLALVLVVLIVALIGTATVVMAGAVLQPKVVPAIKVQPSVVKAGDVVVVTGEGWPCLTKLVLVVALSPTRDLCSECLLPLSATTVAPDGRLAATFVFPSDAAWAALREAWVVVRPGTGNLQAAARLVVHQPRPMPTETPAAAATPIPNQPQVQGVIAQLALQQGLLTLRPSDGSPDRGVSCASATVRFSDGRRAVLADLQVGITIIAQGWFDSGGILLAEQITIVEVTVQVQPTALPPLVVAPATACPVVPAVVPTVCPIAPVVVPTACPVVPVVVPTACPVVPVVVPTPCPVVPTAVPVRPTPVPTTVGAERWIGEFFCNPSLIPPPAHVREAEVIDFDWWLGPPIAGLPREGYSVRWTGLWTFQRTCRYRFRLLLKGAARLSVDGQVLLNLWDSPPPAEYQADVDLAAGLHSVQLEFRNTEPKARVQLRWEYAGAVP